MSKTIASFLVLSALCMTPVLANAQELGNATPNTAGPEQILTPVNIVHRAPRKAPTATVAVMALTDVEMTEAFIDDLAVIGEPALPDDLQSAQDVTTEVFTAGDAPTMQQVVTTSIEYLTNISSSDVSSAVARVWMVAEYLANNASYDFSAAMEQAMANPQPPVAADLSDEDTQDVVNSEEDEDLASSNIWLQDEEEAGIQDVAEDETDTPPTANAAVQIAGASESIPNIADIASSTGTAKAQEPAVEMTRSAADEAPVTGVSVAQEPVVEITRSVANGTPQTTVAEAPAVEVREALANDVPSTDAPAQIALATTDLVQVGQMVSKLDDMNGKVVMDQNGDLMGTIIGINDETTAVEVELGDGRTIALMPEALTDIGNGLVAADLSDVIAGQSVIQAQGN